MKTFNTALTLLLATTASAFIVPNGTANGTYIAWATTNGTSVHERINDFSATAVRTLFADIKALTPAQPTFKSAKGLSQLVDTGYAAITKRQTSKKLRSRGGGDSVKCSGRRVWEADCDDANEGLDTFCGDNKDVPSGGHVFTVGGVVVAYYCNYGGDNKCSAGGRQSASGKITDSCGEYEAGEDALTNYALSYGYDVIGTEICKGTVSTDDN